LNFEAASNLASVAAGPPGNEPRDDWE